MQEWKVYDWNPDQYVQNPAGSAQDLDQMPDL